LEKVSDPLVIDGPPGVLYKKGAELTFEITEESVAVIKKVIVTAPEDMSTVEEWVNEVKVGPVVSGMVEFTVNVIL
tara:strand:- start:137 stop:364 length:228 start_codon:yes stop_codon:yes gene_type:complete